MKTKQTAFRLSQKTLSELDECAKKEKTNRTETLKKAIHCLYKELYSSYTSSYTESYTKNASENTQNQAVVDVLLEQLKIKDEQIKNKDEQIKAFQVLQAQVLLGNENELSNKKPKRLSLRDLFKRR